MFRYYLGGKRDTKQFQQAKQRFAMKQRELEHKKEQYDQKRRAVSTGATQGFLDRFVQIMAHTPHAKLPSELPVKVSARVEEICKYEQITRDAVLIAFSLI